MSKRFMAVAAACMLLLLAAGPALASGKFQKEAQALMDQAGRGLSAGDLAAVLATAQPDATLVYLDGKSVSIGQWKDSAAAELAKRQANKVVFKVLKGQAQRDRGVITYAEVHDYTLKAEPKNKYRIKCQWRATLVKTPQGWRFSEFRQMAFGMTRNGKPFQPPAMSPQS